MGFAHLPALPQPPSWFPGHMMKFTKMLPVLLKRTNVVLEIRDSRLPLTSINRTLEGALRKWRLERGWDPNHPAKRLLAVDACEHIVVLNKRDLVPEWGVEPFRKAMEKKFPHQRILFASWHRPRDIRNLSEMLVNIAKGYPHAMELNVLVIGMPNVGKSTLLNALRNAGIKGRTPKAFQTSANPGMTQALSTRLKVSLDPLVYAYDSPGIMLPYLGNGAEGAERGVKLALIAGIKEGLYDTEALAAYLLYRLNVINPITPAYMSLLPAGSSATNNLEEFLDLLARRMGMVKRGAEADLSRAAVYFVKWWREEGALLSATSVLPPQLGKGGSYLTASDNLGLKSSGFVAGANNGHSASHVPGLDSNENGLTFPIRQAWGFDFQWELNRADIFPGESASVSGIGASSRDYAGVVQAKMEKCIEEYVEKSDKDEADDMNVSPTQVKKKAVAAEKERRRMKSLARQKR